MARVVGWWIKDIFYLLGAMGEWILRELCRQDTLKSTRIKLIDSDSVVVLLTKVK